MILPFHVLSGPNSGVNCGDVDMCCSAMAGAAARLITVVTGCDSSAGLCGAHAKPGV
jgi:broad specificity polyphosphatase/5'/3'-nucleotidase SurE